MSEKVGWIGNLLCYTEIFKWVFRLGTDYDKKVKACRDCFGHNSIQIFVFVSL